MKVDDEGSYEEKVETEIIKHVKMIKKTIKSGFTKTLIASKWMDGFN